MLVFQDTEAKLSKARLQSKAKDAKLAALTKQKKDEADDHEKSVEVIHC